MINKERGNLSFSFCSKKKERGLSLNSNEKGKKGRPEYIKRNKESKRLRESGN